MGSHNFLHDEKYVGKNITVWKFLNFSTTPILRETNFWDPRSSNFCHITHLEALNFDFYEFLRFLKAEINQIGKIHRH